MKLFTTNHLNFEFFDILIYGNFENNLARDILNLSQQKEVILKLIKIKAKNQKILLLKGVEKINISKFFKILKKLSIFWK